MQQHNSTHYHSVRVHDMTTKWEAAHLSKRKEALCVVVRGNGRESLHIPQTPLEEVCSCTRRPYATQTDSSKRTTIKHNRVPCRVTKGPRPPPSNASYCSLLTLLLPVVASKEVDDGHMELFFPVHRPHHPPAQRRRHNDWLESGQSKLSH